MAEASEPPTATAPAKATPADNPRPSAPVARAAAAAGTTRRFVVVARGDTLGDIALRHLGSVNAWPDLMRLITDASRLYPGEVVYLPPSAAASSAHNADDTDVE